MRNHQNKWISSVAWFFVYLGVAFVWLIRGWKHIIKNIVVYAALYLIFTFWRMSEGDSWAHNLVAIMVNVAVVFCMIAFVLSKIGIRRKR